VPHIRLLVTASISLEGVPAREVLVPLPATDMLSALRPLEHIALFAYKILTQPLAGDTSMGQART